MVGSWYEKRGVGGECGEGQVGGEVREERG